MILSRQRVAYAESVLVPRYAVQRVGLAVEEKALLGIDAESPYTETCGYFVESFTALYEFCRGGIEVWVEPSLLKMRIVEHETHAIFL